MKKLFPTRLTMSRRFTRQKWSAMSACATLLFLEGCMATQNRWQATQMRQQVMDYYNDQIMENLIRTKEKLPFVHVDVSSLTTTDAASLAGTIGAGETPSFTRASRPSQPLIGATSKALSTVARGVTRPFAYSVTPTRNTSLQIIATPAFGEIAAANAAPTPSPPPTGPASMLSPPPDSTFVSLRVRFSWSAGEATAYLLSIGNSEWGNDIFSSNELHTQSATVDKIPIDGRTIYVTLGSKIREKWISRSYKYTAASFQPSKITRTGKGDTEEITETETELTPKPAPTPKPVTVYDLYEGFLHDHPDALVPNGSTPPTSGFVQGTIKRWGSLSRPTYYYIRAKNKEDYYNLCKALFTKGKSSIEAKVEQISQREGEAAAERAFLSR